MIHQNAVSGPKYILIRTGTDGELLGIWGPYDGQAAAVREQTDLEQLPLKEGTWSTQKLFAPMKPQAPSGPIIR